MAQTALPALVLAARGECRFSSHRCACCAGAASSDAAARELSLEAGLCTPIDLLEGRHDSVPTLPVLGDATSGSSTKPLTSYSGVACSGGCGEVFCSIDCEKKFAKSGHQLLCVGPLDSLEHPLCVFRRLCGSLGEEVLLGGQLLAAALTEQRQPSQEHEQEQPEEHSFAIGPATSTVRALVARGLAAGRDAAQTTASGASFSLPSGSKSKGSQGKQSKSKQQAKKNKHQNKEAETEEEEEEDEDEGWEGEAFNELRAGLFEAHGIRPREIAVALGAVQGNGGVKSPTKSADNISAGKRWGALLRQVEQCAVPVELESLAAAYCRQAMFSPPSVLAAVESAVAPLLNKIEAKALAQMQSESGAEAGNNENSGEGGDDDDDGGGWETESSNDDGDSEDDSVDDTPSAAAKAASEEDEDAPKKKEAASNKTAVSLWPVGWNPPLGEKADALLSPWTAIALFPLNHLSNDGDGSSGGGISGGSSRSRSGATATKQDEDRARLLASMDGQLSLTPHFRGDLPHSCLPTHILKVEPCDAAAAGGSENNTRPSSSTGSSAITFLGALLEPIPVDQGGSVGSSKNTESSGGKSGKDSNVSGSGDNSVRSGNYAVMSSYSRCYVNASRGRKARARELKRRFGAAISGSMEKGGKETSSHGNEVSDVVCACVRCTWENLALPTLPGATAAAAEVAAEVKDEKSVESLHKGHSDAEVGEVAYNAAVLAANSKKTNLTATAVGEQKSGIPNDVNSIQIESMSISNTDGKSTDAAWELLRRLANQAMHHERYDDALVALAGMRHLKPRDGDALYLTAVALRRLERWSPEKAIPQNDGLFAAATTHSTAGVEAFNKNNDALVSKLDSRVGAHAFFLAANAVASPPHPLLQAAAAEITALDVFADRDSPSLTSFPVEGGQGQNGVPASSEPPSPQEPLPSQSQPPVPPVPPSSSSEESSSSASDSPLLQSTWPVAAVAAACLERKAVAQRTNAPPNDDDTTVDSHEDGSSEGGDDWEDVDDDEEDEDENEDDVESDNDKDSEAKVEEATTKGDELVRSVFVTRGGAPPTSEESSSGVALESGGNHGSQTKEQRKRAQEEGQPEPRLIMAVPRLLSLTECAWAVATAEDFALSRGGWTTQRHYAVPTTDLPLHEVPLLLPWFRDLCKHRIFPLLGVLYPNVVGKPDGSQLRINDAFVVKYCASGQQRHLPLHVDQSTISLTVALNGHAAVNGGHSDAATAGAGALQSKVTASDTGSAAAAGTEKEEEEEEEEEEVVLPTFAGGGTYFESLGEALVPEPGGLVAFPGDCSHGGMPITGGTRYIIAAFLYVLD